MTNTTDWRSLPIADIIDIVLDGGHDTDDLRHLSELIYEDKRGGYLCDLIAIDEFIQALYQQTDPQHFSESIVTSSIVIDETPEQLHPPVSARAITHREQQAVWDKQISPENLLKKPWWYDDELVTRVAFIVGGTATALVIFAAGWLVGTAR